MKSKATALLLVFLVIFFGCASNQPVFNINDSPMVGVKNPSLKNIEDAILSLGNRSKWHFTKLKPGHIIAKVKINDQQATIDITFNTETYNIHYNDSKNLDYDGTKINSRYNGWITKLDRNIRKALQTHQ